MIKPCDSGRKDPFWKILSLIDVLKSTPAPAKAETIQGEVETRGEVRVDADTNSRKGF